MHDELQPACPPGLNGSEVRSPPWGSPLLLNIHKWKDKDTRYMTSSWLAAVRALVPPPPLPPPSPSPPSQLSGDPKKTVVIHVRRGERLSISDAFLKLQTTDTILKIKVYHLYKPIPSSWIIVNELVFMTDLDRRIQQAT